MAYAPIALTIPQYDKTTLANWWLKAYEQGTVNPLSMATDAAAGTLLAKCEIDSEGFPITAGPARFIPFINGDYDLWCFPTESEADFDDTTNAIQFADDLNADPSKNSVIPIDNVVDLKLFEGEFDNQRVSLAAYYDGIVGGGQELFWDATSTETANDGTIFQVTGVVTGRWKSVDTSATNIRWFGASPTATSAVNTAALLAAAAAIGNAGAIYIPGGTYDFDNVSLTGVFDLLLFGDGTATILDFKDVASGDGLSLTYDVPNGGFQRIALRDFTITDSSATSAVVNLLAVNGGPTGASPSQTGAFIDITNVFQGKHNNITNGVGILLRNVSSVSLNNVYQSYRQQSQYGLLIDNDLDINTGVISIDTCYLYGSTHAIYVNQTLNLLDTFTFVNNFCGVFHAVNGAETVRIESAGVIETINFLGNHLESGNVALEATVKIIGGALAASVFKGNHFSCGAVTNQNSFGFMFDNVTLRACEFGQNEFLRLKSSGTGGVCYRFENTCTLDVDEPVEIKGVYRNTTTAKLLEVEAGGNEDLIWSGLVTNPMEVTRILSNAATNTVTTITPPRQEFIMSIIVNNSPTHAGVCYVRCEAGGSGVTLLGGGANFVVGTGIPIGTTGVANSLGVYAHTDGNIYIENRTGNPIGFSINYQQGYFGNP